MAELQIVKASNDTGALGGISRVHRENLKMVGDLARAGPKFKGGTKTYLLFK